MITLKKEIESAINRHCAENESNTPGFILAEYLMDCLTAFDKACNRRTVWYQPDQKKADTTTSIKVFNIDDVEWWAGKDAESVTRAFCAVTGVDEEEMDSQELSEAQLLSLTFYREDGSKCSFKEELERRIVNKQIFPQPFASIEY